MKIMAVTKEAQGRLNAFAEEPQIEIIDKDLGYSSGSWVFIGLFSVVFVALIFFAFTIK
tara:strand:+ start:44 stop:220 length:177 start_codon:yes stop_codon:yes gene_type:complete